VTTLDGAGEAGHRLKQTALRDFGPAPKQQEEAPSPSRRLEISSSEAPIPGLLKLALTLIGLESRGPGEKVAWWVNFTYKGQSCELAHEKFGLRLYLRVGPSMADGQAMAIEIKKKLLSAVRTVETLILDAAPETLGRGDATVRNQHHALLRAYTYFRERAAAPTFIPDEDIEYEPEEGALSDLRASFTSGETQMRLNAFHDLVAALTAYLSLLEHRLVLALAFTDFDPANDDLTVIIGSRWGEKWTRVFGKGQEAAQYRQKLAEVVERWRNPYSHGGFEKGHGATVYLHTPGVGAVPVGLSRVRESPLFSFIPAGESDVAEVFDLLDQLDAWINRQLPEAIEWMRSGLAVRFDQDFRTQVREAREADDFDGLLQHAAYQQDMIDNMDY